MKTTILMPILLLLSLTAMAKDVNLFKVVNKADSETYQLIMEADEDGVATGLKLWDPYEKSMSVFKVKDVKKGMILKQDGDYKVIIMRSNDFEFDRGGHFTVDYLYSGISGKRKTLQITAEFDGTTWKAFYRGSRVNAMVFNPNKFFGKTVGIKSVDVK